VKVLFAELIVKKLAEETQNWKKLNRMEYHFAYIGAFLDRLPFRKLLKLFEEN
jgi:hypothetical protein